MFTLAELVALGFSTRVVQYRVGSGHLHRLYRGVYSLIAPVLLTPRAQLRAAVLACGPGAVASHVTAGFLHAVRSSSTAQFHVTVPGRSRRNVPGVRIHRSTTLRPEDITIIDGIPVTTLARTILDLAETLNPRQLELTLDQAETMDLLDIAALEEQIELAPTRAASHRLKRALVKQYGGTTLTRSELEERFFTVLRAAGLPEPECNQLLALPDGDEPIHPDFIWREHRILLEMDGFKTHRTRRAFEQDRRRDQRTSRYGWRPLRGTWRQMADRPGEIVGTVRAMISASRPAQNHPPAQPSASDRSRRAAA